MNEPPAPTPDPGPGPGPGPGDDARADGQREIYTVPVSVPSDPPVPPPASTERFPAGTVLADRYRIVARVGRGGMGEVYRADDLKLGQSVALKFLPAAMVTDGRWLQRFHEEVRVAREVAHPNICRVYDIVDDEGEHFISMEYIDGEDLDSLLKRIGRLPGDKGIQISRQLCAGLAAAHDKGVLHRDLKPANVMIDGRGNVRLTDFGIAALADELEGADGKAGTPAYMAPEQLEGKRVTKRSDMYSLGLVLYEIFTGREPFAGETMEELRRSRGTSASRPSSHVMDLDPLVERAIMRCLEPDPSQRPASAIAVAAALPGGDPLALALAAGETPSPEMVAHAGIDGSLRPAVAVTMLVATVALLIYGVFVTARTSVLHYRTIELAPAVLLDRVRQTLDAAGQSRRSPHEIWHFDADRDGLEWLRRNDDAPDRWQRLAEGFPGSIKFHYRGARSPMEPTTSDGVVTGGSPPLTAPGMTQVYLDDAGRARSLEVVADRTLEGVEEAAPAWGALLAAAGMDRTTLTEVEPTVTPSVFCTDRAAWEGRWSDDPELPVRVEAGAIGAKAVWLEVLFPWDLPGAAGGTSSPDAGIFFVPMILLVIASATLLAWRHVRRGRGDRRGALRLAGYVLVLYMLMWLLQADHVAAVREMELLSRAFARALAAAAVCWLMYMAVEPYARRYWPNVLVSWTRLISGRWRDPLVGRDVLSGCLAALTLNAIMASLFLVGPQLGFEGNPPGIGGARALLGGRHLLAHLLQAQTSIGFFMGLFVLVLLLRIVLRRQWLATAACVVLIVVPILLLDPIANPMGFVALPIMVLGMLFVVLRLGLLALLVFSVAMPLMNTFPATLDTSAWYFTHGLVGPLAILVPAAAGFWISLGGQAIFRDELG